MAARKRSNPVQPAPNATDDDEIGREALTTLLDEYGSAGGYSVRLQRQSPTPPRIWLYVASLDLTPDLVEDVRLRFGGGNYRGVLYQGSKYMPGRVLKFAIDGKPKSPDDDDAETNQDTGRLARLEEAIAKLSEPKSNGNGLTDGVALVTTLIAALVPVLKSPAGNGPDAVALLALMNTAEEKGERRGRELGRLESGGNDSMVSVAEKYLPPIISLMRDKRERIDQAPASVAPAPISSPPAVIQQPQPSMAPTQEPEPDYFWLASLRPYYAAVVSQANADADPEVIADFAVMKFDDDLCNAIYTASSRPDFTAIMRREFAPIFSTRPEWLAEFLARIVLAVTPDQELPK